MIHNMQTNIKVNIEIELNFSEKSEINAIMKALIPDNVSFPDGLTMEMFSKDNILFLQFTSGSELGSLINTIDEVLDHISIAKRVISDA